MIDGSQGRPRREKASFRPPERSRTLSARPARPARAPRAPRASSRSRSPAHCSVHPLQRARAAPRTAAHTSPRPAPPADGTRRSSRLSAPPRARERVSPPSPAPSPHPPAGAPPRCCAPRPWAHWHHHRVQPCTTPPVLQRRARRSTLSPCTAPSAHSPFPGNRARFVAGRRRRRLR